MEVAWAFSALKTAAAGFSVAGGLHLIRRTPIAQRLRIRQTLQARAKELCDGAMADKAQQPRETTRRLAAMLSSPSAGPLVVSGPEGAGSSAVVAAAIAACKVRQVLYVNLRAGAAADRPWFSQLVRSSGYYVMRREWSDVGLGRFAELDSYDVEICMEHLAAIWRADGAGGHKTAAPRPVLIIDEMHSISENKEEVRKLLRWALFLTDSRLANVVFVARTATALAVDELVPSFRARRRRLLVNFAREQQVVAFLNSRAGWLSAADTDSIVSNLGGHWKDVQAVINASRSGLGAEGSHADGSGDRGGARAEVSALLADSRHMLRRHWEGLLDQGNDTARSRKERVAAYKRGARFWKLARCIAERGSVARSEIVRSTFAPSGGCSAGEVESYIGHGLLTYQSAPCAPLAGDVEDVWLAAASPRLRAAFVSLVSDPASIAYAEKAASELIQQERMQRMEQLASRRAEQAADAAAVGRWLVGLSSTVDTSLGNASADGGPHGSPSGAHAQSHQLLALSARLETECHATLSELSVVREEYDLEKWRGRWSGTTVKG